MSNIYLVGPMGSGKSAVGKRLARMLHRDFYDSDHEIESSTGVDISFIFEKEGEDGFRVREEAMIQRLTQLDEVVIATGGGAILSGENRRQLGSTGLIVYLKTSVAQQVRRTTNRGNRPLLEDNKPEEVLERLSQIRNPLYEQVADLTTLTDNLHVHTVAKTIMEQLRTRLDYSKGKNTIGN